MARAHRSPCPREAATRRQWPLRRGQRPGVAKSGDVVPMPLIRLAYARSGDKGNVSNIGVIARRAEFLPVLHDQLTPERVKAYFAHLVKGKVERFLLPGISAMNFLLHDALDGGGPGIDAHGSARQRYGADAARHGNRSASGTGRPAGRLTGAGVIVRTIRDQWRDSHRDQSASGYHSSRKALSIWSDSGLTRYESIVRSAVGKKISAGMPGASARPLSFRSSAAGRLTRAV